MVQKAASIRAGAFSIYPCRVGGVVILWAAAAIRSREGAMRVREFGQLDGPVVLFGGAYSNLPALRALADAMEGAE